MESVVKRLKDELDTLLNIKRENDRQIEEYLKDERIRQFLSLYNGNEELRNLINAKNLEYMVANMKTCNHAFVVTEVVPQKNGTESRVFKCVKCGLTNEHEVKDRSLLVSYPESIMGMIFKDTFLNSILIYDDVLDIPFEEISKIYDIIIEENPYIGIYELRRKVLNEVCVIRRMLKK